MKFCYPLSCPLLALRLLLLMSLTGSLSAAAQVTAWRPFRPGLVYAFRTAKADTVFTLRVDSLSVDGLDSVYHFNRTVRVLRGGHHYPTKNNLFGARMQFRPGSGSYTFILDADVLGPAQQWTLQTDAAVGSTYAQPAGGRGTATILSRDTRQVLPSLRDEVLTLRTAPDNDSLVFSRRYGAVQLPRSLYRSQRRSRPLYLAEVPVPVAQSRYYSPLVLFDYQPGDEFGYKGGESLFTSFPCSENLNLRRILTRQQTTDSLVYTYLQQSRYRTLSVGAPGCSSTLVSTISPVWRGRLAFSLRTGRSSQLPFFGLFTLESNVWLRNNLITSGIVAGLPITTRQQPSACVPAGPLISNTFLIRRSGGPAGNGAFGVGVDLGCEEHFAAGVGKVHDCVESLACVRRLLPSGQRQECGTCTDFATLLPTRAAQAAQTATLHPNPASTAATLTLAAPARPGTRLDLTDALGRCVWSAPAAAGHTALPVPLTNLPAGLYLLRLSAPGAAPLTWHLEH